MENLNGLNVYGKSEWFKLCMEILNGSNSAWKHIMIFLNLEASNNSQRLFKSLLEGHSNLQKYYRTFKRFFRNQNKLNLVEVLREASLTWKHPTNSRGYSRASQRVTRICKNIADLLQVVSSDSALVESGGGSLKSFLILEFTNHPRAYTTAFQGVPRIFRNIPCRGENGPTHATNQLPAIA